MAGKSRQAGVFPPCPEGPGFHPERGELEFGLLIVRQRVGPVAAYVRTRRLEQAHDLLSRSNGVDVAEVALECGFGDPAHFSRLFHRTYGVPPTRFRSRSGTLREPAPRRT